MTLLTHIQNAVVGRLMQVEFFTQASADEPRPIAVVAEQSGDTPGQIQQHLGALGIVCLVLTPTAVANGAVRERPFFDEIKVSVRVQENVTLNRAPHGTLQPASLVAEAVAWFLHGFAPEGVGGALRLEAIRLVPDAKLLVYETGFGLAAGMQNEPTRLENGAVIPL